MNAPPGCRARDRRRAISAKVIKEIGELFEAAQKDWHEFEPAIFGTLLEQALDAAERRRLGAHYTPRAYVERLVVATIIEPHRAPIVSPVRATVRIVNSNARGEMLCCLRSASINAETLP
jgi:hypothetical protein